MERELQRAERGARWNEWHRDPGAERPHARGVAAGPAYRVSATAASGVATWKLKLSSRYRRTTSPSWDS